MTGRNNIHALLHDPSYVIWRCYLVLHFDSQLFLQPQTAAHMEHTLSTWTASSASLRTSHRPRPFQPLP